MVLTFCNTLRKMLGSPLTSANTAFSNPAAHCDGRNRVGLDIRYGTFSLFCASRSFATLEPHEFLRLQSRWVRTLYRYTRTMEHVQHRKGKPGLAITML